MVEKTSSLYLKSLCHAIFFICINYIGKKPLYNFLNTRHTIVLAVLKFTIMFSFLDCVLKTASQFVRAIHIPISHFLFWVGVKNGTNSE